MVRVGDFDIVVDGVADIVGSVQDPELPDVTIGDLGMVRDLTVVDGVADIVGSVQDPELPDVTIGDLGMVRDLRMVDGVVEVVLVATYTGCPAVEQIREDVESALGEAGYSSRIRFAMNPPWSTDMITDSGRRKLVSVGIAEPCRVGSTDPTVLIDFPVSCPRCGSRRTRRRAEFGATACKSLHTCERCREPFEAFKPR